MPSESAHADWSYIIEWQWRYRMWMHNHYTIGTILILGEYEPSNQDGLSAMCISNGVKHSVFAEAKGNLPTESEHLNQCSDKCGGDTAIK